VENEIGFSGRVRRHRYIPYTGLLLAYEDDEATAYEV
jgi:hypothetical protein